MAETKTTFKIRVRLYACGGQVSLTESELADGIDMDEHASTCQFTGAYREFYLAVTATLPEAGLGHDVAVTVPDAAPLADPCVTATAA